MKKLLFLLLLLPAVGVLQAQDEPRRAKEVRSGGIQIIDGNENRKASSTVRVMFWTSDKSHGRIRVFVNGRQVGIISRFYTSAPTCGANGCVTVTLANRSDNKWYGKADDGTVWMSGRMTLTTGCNRIQLYNTGSRTVPSSSGSGGSSGGTGGSRTYTEADRQWAEQTGRQLGTIVATGMAAVSDTKWGKYCNRIDAGVGYGVGYGELGAKIGYRAPAAFGITAGIGFDPVKREGTGSDLCWNVTLQLWPTNGWNFELGVGSRYFKKYFERQIGVSVMTNYEHQIYGRLGITGGVGFSLSTSPPAGFKKSDVQVRFEWNLGLVIRLFED